MAGCITQDYKDTLLNLLTAEVGTAVMETVVKTIPICSPAQLGKPVVTAEKRAAAEKWPDATFYDKDGTEKTGSFSGLFKEVYGVPVTEDLVCRWWGDKQECRSPSTVENFRNRGAIVKGNGEDAPAPTDQMSATEVERLYKNWKDSLITAGKKIHVYHPEHPTLKQATEEVKKKARKK